MPNVSVIVPVYNVEQYLYRCVDSILGQTYRDFELILVDDGSPDSCPVICDAYAQKDSRVRVIHIYNGGVSHARNVGLDSASGTYIAFCDSDDWWEPQLLEEAIRIFDEQNVDLVSYQYQRHLMDGSCRYSHFPVGTYSFSDWEEKMIFFTTQYQQYKLGFEVWGHLFIRSIIEQHKIRFCETCKNYAEDMGFVGKYLLCANSVSIIDDFLYNLSERDGSMMSRSKYVVKFDELNEVSIDLNSFAGQILPRDIFEIWRGIVHFFVMYNQYQKLVFTAKYRTFPKELAKIEKQKAFRENTYKTVKSKQKLIHLFGKCNARRIIILSHFCLHRNWYLYALDKRIFYFFNRNHRNGENV